MSESLKKSHRGMTWCAAALCAFIGCSNPGTLPQLDPPAISPGGGTYLSARTVRLGTGVSGATIRYTTDGTPPSSSAGTEYAAPVSVASSLTLKAVVSKTGWADSEVASATFTILGNVADPVITPAGGTFAAGQSVTISTATSGATIRYTIDGSMPSKTAGQVFTGPVKISTNTTLNAIAYLSGMLDSKVVSAFYNFRVFFWTQTGPGSQNWQSIASSSDGSHLAACVNGGDIYTSTDGGATWVDRTATLGTKTWSGIASSTNGKYLAACINGGDIYASSDYGVSWAPQATPVGPRTWQSIATSSDGGRLVACENGGQVWISADSGQNWMPQPGPGLGNWRSVASSSDGSRLAACAMAGYIWTSADYGATWTNQTLPLGAQSWTSIASSANGSHLAAGANLNDIWTSDDGGATWVDQPASGNRNWTSIAMSADGRQIVASAMSGSGGVFTSRDAGVNWTGQTPPPGPCMWWAVATSADGSRIVAGALVEFLYIGQ